MQQAQAAFPLLLSPRSIVAIVCILSIVAMLLCRVAAKDDGTNMSCEEYKIKFNEPKYPPNEDAMRKRIFEKNKYEIRKWNARKDVSFKKGINNFSDWTEKELENLTMKFK